jgi:predicted DNA-binding protein with PD1-like motif
MEYAAAKPGRVFLLKFSDNDVLIRELERFAKAARVKNAVLLFLGALRKGTLVAGPRKPRIPPQPNRINFKDGWEVLGAGTIFSNRSGPQVHIHAAMGRKNKVLTGCIRQDAGVFIVIECVVWELTGIKTTKRLDPATGINLLKFLS